jgi:hypothetical protein
MQGWRKSMEDAKISKLNITHNGKNYSLFGVFDGHGGFILLLFRNLSLKICISKIRSIICC